jgi:hypothetical protein
LGNWCSEYIDECLIGTPADVDKAIEFIDLCWRINTDKTTTYGLNFPECYGTGYTLTEDSEDGIWKKGDVIRWGISLTSINQLAYIKLRLIDTLEVYNDDHKSENFCEKIEEYPGPTFSLGHILFGLLWEISWHGNPTTKLEKKDALLGASEKIISGDYESSPYEDFNYSEEEE